MSTVFDEAVLECRPVQRSNHLLSLRTGWPRTGLICFERVDRLNGKHLSFHLLWVRIMADLLGNRLNFSGR